MGLQRIRYDLATKQQEHLNIILSLKNSYFQDFHDHFHQGDAGTTGLFPVHLLPFTPSPGAREPYMPFDHLRYLSKLKNYLFIFLAVLGLRCHVGLSLAAES